MKENRAQTPLTNGYFVPSTNLVDERDPAHMGNDGKSVGEKHSKQKEKRKRGLFFLLFSFSYTFSDPPPTSPPPLQPSAESNHIQIDQRKIQREH
jgi:hypothetical protein